MSDEDDGEQSAENSVDTSDPKSVNAARKRSARKRAEQLEVVKALMAVPNGRAWVYDLLSFCHLHEQPFIPGAPDSTAFRCGEMNVGNRFLADIQECSPQEYLTMLQEAKSNK